MPDSLSVCIVGLGYVGLPLAVALAKRFTVIGFDVNGQRLAELRQANDRTGEVPAENLRSARLGLSNHLDDIRGKDIYIITVPTPVDASNTPDLTAVQAACRTVGAVMKRGAIIVLESTVYPGVTEDVCGVELAKVSGLECGRDFFLGYSPERINPGDRQHTVDRITKVVAGQTPDVAARLAEIYGAVTSGGVFVAKSIKTAEAAKVIENAQRDINIAFINEITMIFNRMGLSVYDVLDASATKWNFLRFTPGLVGGHCIGVDPFYLADLAEKLGHHPAVVLAGRRINDGMATYITDSIARTLAKPKARILVLGLTFKENVPDLRNS
jgi:UDP-N-acetyl-D-galactosamine dehydrogenase